MYALGWLRMRKFWKSTSQTTSLGGLGFVLGPIVQSKIKLKKHFFRAYWHKRKINTPFKNFLILSHPSMHPPKSATDSKRVTYWSYEYAKYNETQTLHSLCKLWGMVAGLENMHLSRQIECETIKWESYHHNQTIKRCFKCCMLCILKDRPVTNLQHTLVM